MHTKIRKIQSCIISPEYAINILYNIGCSYDVIQHCFKVRGLVLECSKKININGLYVDINLVEIRSIIHDIDRSATNGVEHEALGDKLAENFGLIQKSCKPYNIVLAQEF